LIKDGIFETKVDEGMRDPNYYHLTDAAKEALFPDIELVESTEAYDKHLTSYTTFSPKQLFYAPHIQSQIDRLAELLQQDQFKNVTDRLSENGMRKGFACLFYGSPGTGKTETVNQLARMTGRDVLMVDVSQIKSCWVGESEKNIKATFDRYRKLVKEKEVAPILLFNEADAVLGIRQEGAQRAVDKMENSIQNIILQEMETLEGIMIATTNLTCNLDKAFERRFIYKIEFERPTLEAKQQIWKAMIPSLSDAFAHSLAKEFDLSGGQIENVARKRTVELILSGEEPSEEKIREYCMGEMVNSKQDKRAKIGF
jgi:SpoVK/Ycf46/Vps4 family AAA+-type ATPase